VFYNCSSLSNIAVNPFNTSYSSSDGCLFNSNKTAFIQCPNAKTGNYTIPDSVITIGDSSFYNCDGLTSVTVGNSATSIGNSAFQYCGGMTNVTIGSGVVTINDKAFYSCFGLTSLTIPDSVITISDWAFIYCNGLTSVTIGSGVTTIGDKAFYCDSLSNITVNPLNASYSSLDGCLFNSNKTTIIQCPRGKTGSYAIPNSVITVGDSAFYNCDGLTSVAIPDSVIAISDWAFYWCDGLTSVTIPDSVTTIGSLAFSDCSSLISMVIPDSVTAIGDDAFSQCNGLTSVNIGNSVTTIGDRVFMICDSLTNISVDPLNTSYSSLDGCLFNSNRTTLIQCPNAKTGSYAIPNSVITIGDMAFRDCDDIASLTIPDSVTTIGDFVFYWCEGLVSVIIGNGVTTIGVSAFEDCNGLTSVIVPDSVTTIGNGAFYGCDHLVSIYFTGNAPSFGAYVFNHTPVTLYYLPRTAGWESYAGDPPALLWNPTFSRIDVTADLISCTVTGTATIPIELQVSTNLPLGGWSSLTTTNLTGGSVDLLDADTTNGQSRFYRIVSP